MKKNLLSLAMLAGLATSAVNAGEFYLIKDGKIQTGVEVLEYDNDTIGTIVKEATFNGEAAISINPQTAYNDTRFYIAEGVSLAQYWNLEVEFGFHRADLDSATHASANKWAVMEIGLVDDTLGGKYTLANNFAKCNYDVKIKNQPEVWNVEKRFIYAKPSNPSFKEVVLAWQRQAIAAGVTGPVYIKNLKFYGEGNRPFFAEDFDNAKEDYLETTSDVQTNVIDDDGFHGDEYTKAADFTKMFRSDLPITVAMNEGGNWGRNQGQLKVKRLFEDFGSDGSEFYDIEVVHALLFEKVNGKKSGRNGRSFFLIPTSGLESAAGFTIDYLAKWDGSKSTSEDFNEDTEAALRNMNVYYNFVDDALEAETAELIPAFGATDLLQGEWTEYHAEVANEINGKKYIALIFDTPVNFSYCVDNIRIAAVGDDQSLVAAKYSADGYGFTSFAGTSYEGVVAYELGAVAGAVENVISDASAQVYPVPATDVVTVSNEGVEKVEVVNAAGSVVASANGNQVNVAAVANGIYVVKAYTAEGVLVAKIVKK